MPCLNIGVYDYGHIMQLSLLSLMGTTEHADGRHEWAAERERRPVVVDRLIARDGPALRTVAAAWRHLDGLSCAHGFGDLAGDGLEVEGVVGVRMLGELS